MYCGLNIVAPPQSMTIRPNLAALHVLLAAGKLQAADLDAISQDMKVHNEDVRADLLEKWQGHFRRMFEGVPPAVQQPRAQEQDFDAALKSGYGVTLKGCVGQEESR
jgi:hypothetical protein